MRLIGKLVNTILVKTVTYYSLSDVTVIRGSSRGKMGTGISLLLECENGVYCTLRGMNNLKNGSVISLL